MKLCKQKILMMDSTKPTRSNSNIVLLRLFYLLIVNILSVLGLIILDICFQLVKGIVIVPNILHGNDRRVIMEKFHAMYTAEFIYFFFTVALILVLVVIFNWRNRHWVWRVLVPLTVLINIYFFWSNYLQFSVKLSHMILQR